MPTARGVRQRSGLLLVAGLMALVGEAWAQQPAESTRPPADSVTTFKRAIDRGRAIFHGEGTCFACHGAKLEGSAIAPSLRPHQWRNGDGSLTAILGIVTHGVPNTAMVAHPGNINEREVRDVATYVWAVSRGAVPP